MPCANELSVISVFLFNNDILFLEIAIFSNPIPSEITFFPEEYAFHIGWTVISKEP
jgi:hypothetical protein